MLNCCVLIINFCFVFIVGELKNKEKNCYTRKYLKIKKKRNEKRWDVNLMEKKIKLIVELKLSSKFLFVFVVIYTKYET